jgi:hypothetical protein
MSPESTVPFSPDAARVISALNTQSSKVFGRMASLERSWSRSPTVRSRGNSPSYSELDSMSSVGSLRAGDSLYSEVEISHET